MQQRYTNRTVLVTGGASGMGEVFCRQFAQSGAKVAVLDVDAKAGESLAQAIRATGAEAQFILADVTDAASMRQAVDAVCSQYGRLDVAVNSAGIGGGRHLLTEFPLDAWDRTVAVNLTGLFYSLRAEIPLMNDSGGSIINIGSITSVVAHPMTSAYVATKHAVVGLTKSAALEWGHRKIRINAVCPTWVRTPMTLSMFDENKWRQIDGRHAIGRCANAEEIAALVLFLGSDEAQIITGSVYMADGGYTAA
jgi:NAD(P)-dependent dehydrogenase (short-subunit alcohol dehydrogenase family)